MDQTQHPEQLPKKRRLIFISLAVIGLAGLCALGFWLGRTVSADDAAPTIKILPQVQEPIGVPLEAAFDLTSQVALKQETLSSMIQVEPALPFSLTGSRKKWVITPSSPMLKNTVYTFSVKQSSGQVVQSFAFQTISDLALTDAYPTINSTYVPVSTGIELSLNASDVDLTNSFKIMPEVPGKFTTSGYTTTFVPDAPLEYNCVYRISIPAGLTAPNGMVLTKDINYSFTTEYSSNEEKWRYIDLALQGEYAETFLPGDLLVVGLTGLRSEENVPDITFQVDVHRYPDINAYADEIRKKDEYYRTFYGIQKDYRADPSSLEKVAGLQSKLFAKDDNSWSTHYALLPSDLPAGWYLITIQGTSESGRPQFVQKQIQIVDSSVYLESLSGETLVWLNDPVSGNPVEGMTATFEDAVVVNQFATKAQLPDITTISGADGTAVAKTGEMTDVYLSLYAGQNNIYFQPASLSSQEDVSLTEQFYSVLYTDRELYLPSDNINFWGVLAPRKADYVLPKTVTVSFDAAWPSSRFYKQDVAVNADGSFSGSLKITGMKEDYYTLNIGDGTDEHFSAVEPRPYTLNGDNYTQKGLSVSQFKKPPYIMNSTHKKSWYYTNEPIDFTLEATYFDGTPVGNGSINLISSSLKDVPANSSVPVSLDERGQGTFVSQYESGMTRIPDEAQYIPHWNPSYLSYSMSAGGAQDAHRESYDRLPIYYSKIACILKSEKNNSLTINTSYIDEEKVNLWHEKNMAEMWNVPAYEDYEDIIGSPADIPVTVYIKRRDNIKIPISSYYDPISKETITRYKYDSKEVLVDTIKTATKSGTVTLQDLDILIEDTQYHWFEVVFDGQVNGEVKDVLYKYGDYIQESEQPTQYSFTSKGDEYPYAENKYDINSTVPIGLYKHSEKEQNKGRILYSINQHNRIEGGIFTEDEKNLTFTEAYVPNVKVFGAYFDGRHVYNIQSMDVSFNYDNRILDVDISSDKEKYAPGEKAVVTVKISDKQGKPVAATACVGIVDEAMFALAPQNFQAADQLYQTIFSPYVKNESSYVEYDLAFNPNTGGGMGGGGGDGSVPRKEFANTALFQTVIVDASGTAQVSLTLPDDITSWRITAGAVTSDTELKGGSNTSQTISTLPFQIRPIVTDSYLDGDDVSISVTPITALKYGGPAFESAVNYDVSLKDISGKTQPTTKKATGTVGVPANINFGKMPLGQYKLTVSATCGTFTDAVELPFSVAQQGPTTSILKNCSLDELKQVESLRYPVNITIFDKALTTYMDALAFISYPGGKRTEQLIAAFEASSAFQQLLPEEDRVPIGKDARLEEVQQEDGGIIPLPVAASSPETTAKILMTAPSFLNQSSAAVYLRKVLASPASTPDDRIMAYAGLAAIKEPVLIDIKRILKQPELSPTQKLTLATGLAKAGDSEGGRAVYEELAASMRTVEVEKEKEQIYFKAEVSVESLKQTGAALMLASFLHHPDAEGLASWLLEQYSTPIDGRTTMANLELLSYISNFIMPESGKGKFAYVQYGEEQTAEIGTMGVSSLTLTAEDFAASNFKAINGELSASIEYTGIANSQADSVPGASTEKSLISLKKTITPVSNDVLTLFGQARVELELRFEKGAPAGCYEISDLIPAGMRYINQNNAFINPPFRFLRSMSTNEGQQVKAYIYYNPNDKNTDGAPMPIPREKSIPIPDGESMPLDSNSPSDDFAYPLSYTFTYFTSCSLPGEFISTSAVVYSAENQLTSFSENLVVKIPEK